MNCDSYCHISMFISQMEVKMSVLSGYEIENLGGMRDF